MPKISGNDITVHAQKITELSKQYKGDGANRAKIIREMRVSHGCAIYDFSKKMEELSKRPEETITDEEWLKLSVEASLLSLIQKRIDSIDMIESISKQELEVETETKPVIVKMQIGSNGTNQRFKPKANFRKKPTGTDEITVSNMETYVNTGVEENNLNTPTLFTDTNSATINTISANRNTLNTTEYINNLTTTEANDLLKEYEKNQTGGQNGPSNQKVVGINYPSNQDAAAIHRPSNQTAVALDRPSNQDVVSVDLPAKQTGGENDYYKIPTLINFWADWCPASQKFKPTWDTFIKSATKNFPQLKIYDVNVKRNNDLIDCATKVGVEGYPTVVLLYKDKIHHLLGNKSVKDIEKFVRDRLA